MDLGWILLGLVGWGILTLITYTLMRMSADQARDARHEEGRFYPYGDDTVTQSGIG
jgi:hypothetical protein